MIRLLTLITLVSFCSLPSQVGAHAFGNSFERFDGQYLVDIGYPDIIVAGAPARFDTLLFTDEEALEDASFDSVWVRIFNEQKTFFAGALDNPVIGNPGFMLVLSELGTTTVSISYYQGTTVLTGAEFPVVVTAALNESTESKIIHQSLIWYGGLFLIGVLILLLGSFFVRKFRQ